jgi:hypothetical protein
LKQEIPDAPKILLRNVYGWFERVERGLYGLTETGRAAIARRKTHPPATPERLDSLNASGIKHDCSDRRVRPTARQAA